MVFRTLLMDLTIKWFISALVFFFLVKQEDSDYAYSFPAELGEQPETGPGERSRLEYSEQPYYYEHLHPIGWSRDGKLAVLLWSNHEFAWSWQVKVLDLVNDKVLYDDSRNSEDPSWISKEQVKAKWERNTNTIGKYLNEHSILPQSEFKTEKFPFTLSTDSGEVVYDIKVKNTEDTTVTSSAIIMKSEVSLLMKYKSQQYSKKIFSDTSMYAWDVYSEGFLKSPYENRVAVLLKVVHPGQHFSVPNSSVSYVISGAALNSRFRATKR